MKLQAFQKCKKLTKYPNFRKNLVEHGVCLHLLIYLIEWQAYALNLWFPAHTKMQSVLKSDEVIT